MCDNVDLGGGLKMKCLLCENSAVQQCAACGSHMCSKHTSKFDNVCWECQRDFDMWCSEMDTKDRDAAEDDYIVSMEW